MFSLKEKIEIQKYFSQKKELQNLLLRFIENTNDSKEDFQNLIENLKTQNYSENREELEHFLRLLLKIYKNHHRNPGFFSKIEQILLFFLNDIKQTFSNLEIYNIFKSSKQILLFLIDNKLINLDESIISLIFEKNDRHDPQFRHFFYPELKKFIDEVKIKQIEKELLEQDSNIFTNFEENRRNGENNSPICRIIREDSVEEFVSLVNSENISISGQIPYSIFETNSFLIDKKPTLIEYAVFYGSIQIFEYLKENKIELTPSLWLFAVHSNKAELIHLLEESQIDFSEKNFECCFEESIKCHHNYIANFFQSKIQNQNDENLNNQLNFGENVVECSFRYCNYSYFPNDFSQNCGFYYLCRYNYSKIVKLFLKTKKNEIESSIILNIFLFFNRILIISYQILFKY